MPEMPNPAKNKNGFTKGILTFLLIALLGWFALSLLARPFVEEQKRPLSEVLQMINRGEIKSIEVSGDTLIVTPKEGEKFNSAKESNISFAELLTDNKIDPQKISEGFVVKEPIPWGDFLFNVVPIVLTGLLFVFIFRQARGAGSQIFSFGKSRARLFVKGMGKEIKFSDVAGAMEAKRELTEVVDFLKHPEKYLKLGARIPRGVLLVGPPGVGKTMLAKAVANEAGVPFFSMAGSEFMEMLVGVGASRVRDLFDTAKKSAPALIFIDELEAIGRQRGMTFIASHDEREQTLNQILVEMDGFETGTNVIVLAASNRPDLLDPALLRPGRFDRRIVLELPDVKEREEILKIHMRGKPASSVINIGSLAQRTVGFSGADIENMLNEAAILAARVGKKEIDADDLEEAATKVKMGPERRRIQSDEEKRVVAYHEAGHAVVARSIPGMDPVHRVSIVARGLSLGFTMFPPKVERQNETKTRLLGMITAALGGRAAEELKFKELTIGAASDLDQATGIARQMVVEFGMSDLGPVSFDGQEQMFFRQFGESGPSQESLASIDREIRRIINGCYKRAVEILKKNAKKLDLVAEELTKKENLMGEEFEGLMRKSDPNLRIHSNNPNKKAAKVFNLLRRA